MTSPVTPLSISNTLAKMYIYAGQGQGEDGSAWRLLVTSLEVFGLGSGFHGQGVEGKVPIYI